MALSDRLSTLAHSVLDRASPGLPSGSVVVALSGGADSAVCAWVAVTAGRPVRALHVDHGLAASEDMAEAARRVAAILEIAIDEVVVDVGSGASAEGRARDVRYRALEEAVKPDESLISGHTADDQAETVLGHLLRGAGAGGLAGIPPRRGRWFRPLLGVTRSETRQLANELGLPYRDDPANLDPRHRRNRIRKDLVPYLEAEYNPALRRTLRRSAQLLADDDTELEKLAARVPIREEAGAFLLPAPLLATLPLAVASRAVRRGLRAARGPHAGLAYEVDAIIALTLSATGSVSLAGGVQATREGPWVALYGEPPAAPGPVSLNVPGSVEFGPWTITSENVEAAPVTVPGGLVSILDGDVVGTQLEIGTATPGERIDIDAGTKKVATVLSEAGVAPRLRPGWPIAFAHGMIAWIGGIRTAAWAARKPATESFVTLWMED